MQESNEVLKKKVLKREKEKEKKTKKREKKKRNLNHDYGCILMAHRSKLKVF